MSGLMTMEVLRRRHQWMCTWTAWMGHQTIVVLEVSHYNEVTWIKILVDVPSSCWPNDWPWGSWRCIERRCDHRLISFGWIPCPEYLVQFLSPQRPFLSGQFHARDSTTLDIREWLISQWSYLWGELTWGVSRSKFVCLLSECLHPYMMLSREQLILFTRLGLIIIMVLKKLSEWLRRVNNGESFIGSFDILAHFWLNVFLQYVAVVLIGFWSF